MKENKSDRFKRLATVRTRAILQKIRILGNCSNKNAYDYTDAEIRTIFTAIEEQLREVRGRFRSPKDKEFHL